MSETTTLLLGNGNDGAVEKGSPTPVARILIRPPESRIGSQIGRQIVRGVLGSLLGGGGRRR